MMLLHPYSGKQVRAVLFDLDGTLVDSAPDIAFAVNTILVEDGAAPHSVETVRSLIGEGIHRLVEKAYGLHQRNLDVGLLNERTTAFAAIYAEHIADLTTAYPRVEEGLSKLKERGVKSAVVSNKAQHLTDRLLHSLNLEAHFNLILGARDDLPKKPAPDMLQYALRALNVTEDEAIFVGDSIADVKAAAAANLPCVLIDGGYTVEPAAKLGAWRTVPDFSHFVSLIVTGQ
jgi:phosphoglycolate phosphatase